jgi:hypothetical protein
MGNRVGLTFSRAMLSMALVAKSQFQLGIQRMLKQEDFH